MKRIIKQKIVNRSNLFLAALLFIGLVTSIPKLNEVPPGMSHDELEYVNNGYSIYKTGKDLYGTFLPLSIGGVGYVAIPAYIAGLPTIFLGLNEYSVRLFPAIFATLEILLLYKISRILFKSERIAISAAFILTLSTWGLKISRTMLDSSTALFFFILGIFIFLKAKNIQFIVLAFIAISLGTLSYYGSLFLTPFVVLILVIYRWKFLKTIKKQFFISSMIVFFIVSSIVLYMLFKPGENSRSLNRSGELIFFNSQKITDNVIYDRSYSSDTEILNELFINKFTYLWRTFFSNYLEAFSPKMIFVEGDPNINYGLWDRGEMGILDFPLLLLGIFYLHRKFKKELWLVGCLILVSPITSGLTGTVYATRAFLMWPFLMILAGGGLAFLWEWFTSTKKVWRKIFFAIFLTMYIFFFFSKIHQYFYRYQVYARETWFDSEKQLAFYLIEHSNEQITIYSQEGRQVFMEYFFFSKMDPRIAQLALSKENIKADILVNNFRFVNGCINPIGDKVVHKVIVHTDCVPLDLKSASDLIRTRDRDNRVKWAIFKPK